MYKLKERVLHIIYGTNSVNYQMDTRLALLLLCATCAWSTPVHYDTWRGGSRPGHRRARPGRHPHPDQDRRPSPTLQNERVPGCITSCRGLADGDYPSCSGCHLYSSCSGGRIIKDRPCPAGLKYEEDRKRCERTSRGCVQPQRLGDKPNHHKKSRITDCILSCRGRADGDYHSCKGCNFYSSCSAGRIIKDRPCAAGLKFDANKRRCDYKSRTCGEVIKPKPPQKPQNKTKCITNCTGLKEGNYPSCKGCGYFSTCSAGRLIPNRRCPPKLQYDATMDRCEYISSTCGNANYTMTSIRETSADGNGSTKLHFQMDGSVVDLTLENNKNVPSDVPVYMMKNGKIQKFASKKGFEVLMDKQNYASILAEQKNSKDGHRHRVYNGNFMMGGHSYQLQEMQSNDREEQIVPDYAVSPVELIRDNLTTDSLLRPENKMKVDMAKEITDLKWSSDSSKKYYTVQFLLVIDYALYNSWYQASKATTAAERQADALYKIRFYFSHVANGIDLRYRSIQDPGFALSAKLVGFYIATTPDASPFTEGSYKEQGNERSFVNADKSLTAFEDFINRHAAALPHHDQASLYTGHIMYNRYRADGTRNRIQGLADVASVCDYRRATINMFLGVFGSIQTGAHEMGHNLAAYHDGSGNACNSADQFVMANAPGGLTDANYKNAYTFSYCSVNYFRHYLMLLTRQNKNCLTNSAEHLPEVERHLYKLPGQMFDVNEQCRMIHGQGSYYCASLKNDADLCREMTCYVPRLGSCYRASDQRAATGTQCGDRKWCMKSTCVFDGRAPPGKDKCLYGDLPGKQQDTGETCEQSASAQPWRCYLKWFQDKCCASCGKILNNSNPQCQYGDKHGLCLTLKKSECYDQNRRNLCCATCQKFKRDVQGCEYGDKATWCSNLFPGKCLFSQESQTCCEKCPKLKTTDPNCPFGDRDKQCANLHRLECYHNRERCCKTCEKHRTGIAGCEFGDKSSHCTRDDCRNPNKWNTCCYTCREEAGIKPRATTTSTTAAPSTSTVRTTTTAPATTTTTTQRPTVKTTTTQKPSTTTTATTGDRDKADWCKTIPARYCYYAHERGICPATCARKKLPHNTTGCEYGDARGWCTDVKQRNCYDPYYQKNCCLKCKLEPKAPKGCEFGDKISGCSLLDCSDKYRQQYCCGTCTPAVSTKPTTTTTTTRAPTTATTTTRAPTTTTTTTRAPTTTATTTRAPTTTTTTTRATTITTRAPTTTATTTRATTTTATTTTTRAQTTTTSNRPSSTTITSTTRKDTADWCVKMHPSMCYRQRTRESICPFTCSQLRNSSDPDCEYGDKYGWCASIDIMRCEEEVIRKPCRCVRCKKFGVKTTTTSTTTTTTTTTTPPPTTTTTSTTTTTTTPTTTTTAATTTSITNKPSTTTRRAMVPKDKVSWCVGMPPSYCYVTNIESDCPTTCHHYLSLFPSAPKGCHYGDQRTWCSDYKLEDRCRWYSNLCCYSCRT